MLQFKILSCKAIVLLLSMYSILCFQYLNFYRISQHNKIYTSLLNNVFYSSKLLFEYFYTILNTLFITSKHTIITKSTISHYKSHINLNITDFQRLN
ncbi:hypothetical protein ECH_0506 [Ehrlichia chaffeensis str. Arkansas]|uniref:Uncharacterized protein n=1 Tax=Ehrlichia chaffeensis (strain ATCC CRL-10679 / Arkansas) TaxID=205920 RepID=Q2GGW2_EHRCR|nr:hypothetical protein ECH_0506 [Ehrlichia chaffeensis str. Arkansas]